MTAEERLVAVRHLWTKLRPWIDDAAHGDEDQDALLLASDEARSSVRSILEDTCPELKVARPTP